MPGCFSDMMQRVLTLEASPSNHSADIRMRTGEPKACGRCVWLAQWFHLARSIVSYGSLNSLIWFAQLFRMARASRRPEACNRHATTIAIRTHCALNVHSMCSRYRLNMHSMCMRTGGAKDSRSTIPDTLDRVKGIRKPPADSYGSLNCFI